MIDSQKFAIAILARVYAMNIGRRYSRTAEDNARQNLTRRSLHGGLRSPKRLDSADKYYSLAAMSVQTYRYRQRKCTHS